MKRLCYHRLQFLFVSDVSPESSHDHVALHLSGMFALFPESDSRLPRGFWVSGDEAYVFTRNFLTPRPSRSLNAHWHCFNFWLSSARIIIEQSFGFLVSRWGILWKTLGVCVQKATQVVVVFCELHKFIIEEVNSSYVPKKYEEDLVGVMMNIARQDDFVRS